MPVLPRLHPLLAAETVSRQSAALLLPPSGATIPVGGSPLGVTLTPDGARAYVANRASNTVSVIDTATETVTATIAAAGGPTLLAFSPDGTRAYLTLFDDGAVDVIDTAAGTITATIAVGAGAVGVAVGPDGNRAYVTSQNVNTLSVINTATDTVTATLTVGAGPVGVAISPDGTRGYVANTGDGTVSVIDTVTNTVTGSILVGDVPVLVAFTPDGSRAYVSTAGENAVNVIDTASNTVTATIPVITPRVVAMSPDGVTAYVADLSADTVTVLDVTTNTAAGTIPVGNGPTGAAISPDGTRLYVTNTTDNTVSVVPLTLVPDQGPAAGGIILTIRGHNLAPVTAVRFGDTAATILANTATSVTVRIPPGSGAVPVTATTPGGTGVLGTFYYRPAPLLTGITTTSNPYGGAGPAMGPLGGGGTAVITGVNLSGATAVRFGPTRQAIIQSVTDTAITLGIPGVPAPGPVPVTVLTPGGSAGGLTFTYLDVPALTGVSPAAAPTGGGTDVTITGTNLATTHEVTFDGTPVPFTAISDQQISATAPPHPAGQGITIAVNTLGGSYPWSIYTYEDGPAI
ncbi:IPT/TIG domain-containing protein [Streptomyces atratus]|uniref:IPT/TIG domain-containing protein n=1 Tax=Streptomyces atratus TaxID=1893 RepID=UPI0036A5AD05